MASLLGDLDHYCVRCWVRISQCFTVPSVPSAASINQPTNKHAHAPPATDADRDRPTDRPTDRPAGRGARRASAPRGRGGPRGSFFLRMCGRCQVPQPELQVAISYVVFRTCCQDRAFPPCGFTILFRQRWLGGRHKPQPLAGSYHPPQPRSLTMPLRPILPLCPPPQISTCNG